MVSAFVHIAFFLYKKSHIGSITVAISNIMEIILVFVANAMFAPIYRMTMQPINSSENPKSTKKTICIIMSAIIPTNS